MKLWQLHRDLSLSLGDGVVTSTTSIPDGVRFSKNLRDSYLYRAMLELLHQVMRQLVTAPKPIIASILTKTFPNFIRYENPASSSNIGLLFGLSQYKLSLSKTPLYIINAIGHEGENGSIRNAVPIPVKDFVQMQGLRNSRNVQRPDSFCYWDSYDSLLAVYSSVSMDYFSFFEVAYLPYPTDPNTQDADEDLNFEESFIQTVIAYATLYAKIDSQEIESLDRFMPLILGGQNAGN